MKRGARFAASVAAAHAGAVAAGVAAGVAAALLLLAGAALSAGAARVSAAFAGVAAASPDAPLPALSGVIPLPGVAGRLDHMALDSDGARLFLAALGNNTLEVVDVRSGKRLRSVRGLSEPQGVAFAGSSNRLLVTNGGSGAYSVFEGTTLAPLAKIALGEDADNVRYDRADERVYVGYGAGAIGILDAEGTARLGDVAVGRHPEAFEVEPGDHRAFVNVPERRQVVVVDLDRRSVAARWPIRAAGNFPMALDAADSLLLVGCREPARLLALDTRDGREVESVPIDGDADDVWIDPGAGRVYVSCGAGYLDVFETGPRGRLRAIGRVRTSPGARTSLLDTAGGRIFVAAPRAGGHPARMLEFTLASKGRANP